MQTEAGWLGLERAVDGIFDVGIQKALRAFFGERLFDPLLALVEQNHGRAQPGRTVLLLPGILGTHLSDYGQGGAPRRLWLDLRDLGAVRDLRLIPGQTDLEDQDTPEVKVRPEEPLVEAYGLMTIYLRHVWGMKVVPFPYDWRRSIDANARLLVDVLPKVLPDGPFSVVAHSMGALMLRRCVHFEPTILGRIDHAVCMGAPFQGSFVPLDVVAGRYWLSRLFEIMGAPGAEVLATCPGFLEMIPRPMDPDMVRLLTEPLGWPMRPLSPFLLPRARAFMQGLLEPSPEQVREADLELRRRCSIILGRNLPTPDRVEWVGERPSFPAWGRGDSMVPASSARDALAMRHYETLWSHPFIAQDPEVVQGTAQLLHTNGKSFGPLRPLDPTPDWVEISGAVRSTPPEVSQGPPAGFEERRKAGLWNNEDLHWLFAAASTDPAEGQSDPSGPARTYHQAL